MYLLDTFSIVKWYLWPQKNANGNLTYYFPSKNIFEFKILYFKLIKNLKYLKSLNVPAEKYA